VCLSGFCRKCLHFKTYVKTNFSWFEASVIDPLIKSGLVMSSDKHIQRVDCPILVFHAQDDHIIPVKLGRKLVESAMFANRTVKYVEFDKDRHFLHKYIHRASELPAIVM
jgi:abhydrolase domain-containing protein 12